MKEEAIKETTGDDSDEPSVVRRVREFVRGYLSEGAKASDLAFALAFVATEMGLAISSDPVSVFSVVLKGISHAAAVHPIATAEPTAAGEKFQIDAEESIPPGATVH